MMLGAKTFNPSDTGLLRMANPLDLPNHDFLLQQLSFTEPADIGETKFLEQFFCLLDTFSHILSAVGVRTDRHNGPALFPIPLQKRPRRKLFFHSLPKT